jgi:hypothetical protein
VSWRTSGRLYVQGIRQGAKARGLDPASLPGRDGIAAMNDLAVALHAFARNAASASAE